MPGITFEIDPNVGGKASNYSSLVFMPANSRGQRVEPVHRRHHDRLLGPDRRRVRAAPRATSTAPRCTFAELKDYLDDGDDNAPTILTVAVSKGRDYFWSGAVDGLRINDTVVRLRGAGVFTTAP